MQELNLPPYPFKILKEKGKFKIFDPIRRKYLVLTPEEWVRQHFIQYLINSKGFPKGLLRLEVRVKHHQRQGRYDALFVDRTGRPHVLIECKAPDISLSRETLEQIARYNSGLQADYLVVTNGLEHFYLKPDPEKGELNFIEDIPEYPYLSNP